MTPITSSAASETESARNLTPGAPARPPRSRPRRRRRAGGRRAARPPGRARGSAARPRRRCRPRRRSRRHRPSSLRTPARKSSWSSTRTTRRFTVPPESQLDLGALAGLRGDRRGAAGAPHAALDRLGDPSAVGRDGGAVEAAAAIADEHGAAGGVGLGVHRDLVGARELGGVRHRLARGENELLVRRRRARRAPAVASSISHAVELLDLGRGVGECVLERGGVLDAGAVEPAAELALLPARDRRDTAGIVGVPLHERQCLQHRVVDARRDRCALGEADALGALGGELPEPRAENRISAPAIAPGATNEPDAPRRPSRSTAPAVVSRSPGSAASRRAGASRRAAAAIAARPG